MNDETLWRHGTDCLTVEYGDQQIWPERCHDPDCGGGWVLITPVVWWCEEHQQRGTPEGKCPIRLLSDDPYVACRIAPMRIGTIEQFGADLGVTYAEAAANIEAGLEILKKALIGDLPPIRHFG